MRRLALVGGITFSPFYLIVVGVLEVVAAAARGLGTSERTPADPKATCRDS